MHAEGLLAESPRAAAQGPGWRAWHVFLGRPDDLERLLVETVEPEARALWNEGGEAGCFFLRYWENGPHIRLRVRGVGEERFQAIGRRLREHAAVLAQSAPAAGAFGSHMRFDGWHADPAGLPWLPQGAVAEIMYEPEYRRYGGPLGLPVNEALFGASSAMALAIVANTRDAWRRRQAMALELTAAAIGTAVEDLGGFAAFADRMAAAWRGYSPDAAEAEAAARLAWSARPEDYAGLVAACVAGSGGALHPLVGRWAGQVRRWLEQLRLLARQGGLISPLTGTPTDGEASLRAALLNMLLSQIHMTNNRLGVPPEAEFVFARILHLSATAAER